MAKARVIIKRRKAVSNIKRITQTMQLIATARYQKCLQRAVATQPYTRKITEMIEALGGREAADHPLLSPSENRDRGVVLMITSNRGLCGSYNAAVLRKLTELRRQLQERGITPAMEVVGKKGVNYLRFLGAPIEAAITDVEDRIVFSRVAAIADRYMAAYQAGKIARVDVLYTRFQSVAVQRPSVAQLLPIEASQDDGAPSRSRAAPGAQDPDRERAAAGRSRDGADARGQDGSGGPQNIEFEYSPPPAQLLARLIPEAVKIRLYQYFNDSIVSEQVARMVAMKAATDAAGDMVKHLTRAYNRARQSQITMELADIVGGANAVQ